MVLLVLFLQYAAGFALPTFVFRISPQYSLLSLNIVVWMHVRIGEGGARGKRERREGERQKKEETEEEVSHEVFIKFLY